MHFGHSNEPPSLVRAVAAKAQILRPPLMIRRRWLDKISHRVAELALLSPREIVRDARGYCPFLVACRTGLLRTAQVIRRRWLDRPFHRVAELALLSSCDIVRNARGCCPFLMACRTGLLRTALVIIRTRHQTSFVMAK